MTTPNTLKATLTSDVAAAQAGIQRLIKTVEDMGRTVNATSAAGQKAFKAEADSVALLLKEMNASEKQLQQLTNARVAFAQRVKSESQAAASAAASMATAHGAAAKDVVKGLASIAQEAKVTAGGLKDILSGVGSLAFAMGPTGAFVSAIAIAASSVVGLFQSARDEMEKTQKEFAAKLGEMQKTGNAKGLRDEAKAIYDQLVPLQQRLSQAQQNDFGGLTVVEGLRARRTLPEQIATLERQLADIRERALNPGPADIDRATMQRITVTANAPGRRPAGGAARSGPTSVVGSESGILGTVMTGNTALRDAMDAAQSTFRDPSSNVLAAMAEAAQKPITAMQLLRAEIRGTGEELKHMGDLAKFALTNGLSAGLDAVITGQGNAVRALKRTAAEPIVAKLRMNAVESLGDAAKYAASFNFAGAAAALASATKNTLGAMAVARLGGISAGGTEGAGGGGASAGDPSFGRRAALAGDGLGTSRSEQPMRIEMVIVQRTPDGRELARTRQQIQRLDDRNQPIRVTL